GHGPAAAGHADSLADLGDGAHLGVLALVPRDEQHALLVADVDGDGDVHVREDDEVVQRYEERRAHVITLLLKAISIIVASTLEVPLVFPARRSRGRAAARS